MSDELKKLRKEIFFGNYSDDEWYSIKERTEAAIEKASEEDVKIFIDCGSYSLLEQVLEYL